jgi:hypothetical protein
MQRKFEYENVVGKRSMGRRKRRWENIISLKEISKHEGKLRAGSNDRIMQTSE